MLCQPEISLIERMGEERLEPMSLQFAYGGYDGSRRSPCCHAPVVIERRSIDVWGGREELAPRKICEQCEGTVRELATDTP